MPTKKKEDLTAKTAEEHTLPQKHKTYTVKVGDSLWAIAEKFLGSGSRYPEIRDLNGIKNDNVIYAGQLLKIPEGDQQ